MANSFNDLELLMEHNIKLSVSPAVSQPRPSRSIQAPSRSVLTERGVSSSSASEQSGDQAQSLTSNWHPAFASLSLAFGPVSAPPSLHVNPGLRRPSAINAKAPIALPSQKKCISPMPLMPAISAATVLDSNASLSLRSRKASISRTFFPDYQRLSDPNNTSADPSNGAAMRKASIVWFRKDLRIHDNEALLTASNQSSSVLPVYIFNSNEYGKSSSGFGKVPVHHVKFLLQSVENLRQKLRELGSELVVRIGKPEEVLVSLAKSIGADTLYTQQEVSYEELQSERKVFAVLQEEGVDVKFSWGSTLFHMADLPFKLEEMPTTHSQFREKVQNVAIRPTLETPKQLKGLPVRGGVKPGDMPTFEELGARTATAQGQERGRPTSSSSLGGEAEALEKLKILCADQAKQASKLMEQACNQTGGDSLHGSSFSCKISPWLSLGCISPRHIYEQLRSEEKSCISANPNYQGTNSVVFELLWRDFFRFITRKSANCRADATTERCAAVPA